MDNKKFKNVLEFYSNHCILAETERTGWISWNVSGRRESITDHISNAQVLAWSLWSEFEELQHINIEHVISMLSVHEEGETKIGDITPFQNVSPEEKAHQEWMAYTAICAPLRKGKYILSLFEEFEAKETDEAIFAYLCDKLDALLRAKFYCENGRCNIANATYAIISNKNIQKIIEDCAKTAFDIWWKASEAIFKGTFLEEFFYSLKSA